MDTNIRIKHGCTCPSLIWTPMASDNHINPASRRVLEREVRSHNVLIYLCVDVNGEVKDPYT